MLLPFHINCSKIIKFNTQFGSNCFLEQNKLKMMKNIFIIIGICTVLMSCKKDKPKTTSPDLTPRTVSFKVGFSQNLADFKINGVKSINSVNAVKTLALSDQVSIIYYAVYDASENLVRLVKQLSTESNFGNYSDKLAPGTYTVVVVAGGQGLVVTSTYGV